MDRKWFTGLLLLAFCFIAYPAPAETIQPAAVRTPNPVDLDPKYQLTTLHIAARDGDLAEVRRLLDRGAAMEARDSLNRTPLHLAAMWNHLEVVRLLLDRGADVNARDQWGVTPFRRMALLEKVRNMDRGEVSALLRARGGAG